VAQEVGRLPSKLEKREECQSIGVFHSLEDVDLWVLLSWDLLVFKLIDCLGEKKGHELATIDDGSGLPGGMRPVGRTVCFPRPICACQSLFPACSASQIARSDPQITLD
jgi:hypothetical protein